MRLLLIGGSSFIGKNLIEQCPSDWEISASYCKTEGFLRFASKFKNVKPFKLDLIEETNLNLGSYDIVIYLAAASPGDKQTTPEEMYQLHSGGVTKVINGLSGCGKFIYLSSGVFYLRENSGDYRKSRLLGEANVISGCKMKNFNWIILRNMEIYGKYMKKHKLYRRLLEANLRGEKEFEINGNGENLLDTMYIDDYIRGLISLINSRLENETLDFCKSSPVSIKQLAEAIKKVCDNPDFKLICKDIPPTEDTNFRLGNEEMKKKLSFYPSIELEQGLRLWKEKDFNKKILVTGGCGFIGSNLVQELLKNPCNEVIVVDNFTTGKRENLKEELNNPRLKIIEADIRDKEKMFELSKNIDTIYHLAVQCVRLSFSNPELVHEVNATGTLNLCLAAVKNNVNKFVYVSSSEAYGTAESVPMNELHPLRGTTVYGASKAAGELYTLAAFLSYGLPIVIIRPFNNYGPNEHFEGAYGEVIPKFVVRALNNLPILIHGDGEQTRDFIYVKETVQGIIKASESESLVGQAVNIAYGQEITINQIAEAVREVLNIPMEIIHTPSRPGDVRRHYADTAKARNHLGFKAEIDIKQGIKKYVEWLFSQNFNLKEMAKKEKEFNWK